MRIYRLLAGLALWLVAGCDSNAKLAILTTFAPINSLGIQRGRGRRGSFGAGPTERRTA